MTTTPNPNVNLSVLAPLPDDLLVQLSFDPAGLTLPLLLDLIRLVVGEDHGLLVLVQLHLGSEWELLQILHITVALLGRMLNRYLDL